MFEVEERAVFQADYKDIKLGTVCTVLTNIDKSNVIVRYGYDEATQKTKMIAVPIKFLRKAELNEIKGTDYKNIVHENFHIGKKFKPSIRLNDKLTTNKIGEIVDIQLDKNSKYDTLIFNFDGEEYSFQKHFVEMYFYVYDEEIENMLGDEMDLKNAKKNYYLPGARMKWKDQIVIFSTFISDNECKVLDLDSKIITITKDELEPIKKLEYLYEYGINNVIEKQYRIGNKFVATNLIEKNVLLRDIFKAGDIIQIIGYNQISCNVFDDIFVVHVNDLKENTLISYHDIKRYFDFYEENYVEDQYFSDKEIKQDSNNNIVKILKLNINNFDFDLHDGKFTLDNKLEVRYDEIDKLINALIELKNYMNN